MCGLIHALQKCSKSEQSETNRLTREYCTETGRRRNSDMTRARRSGLHTTKIIEPMAANVINVINMVPAFVCVRKIEKIKIMIKMNRSKLL